MKLELKLRGNQVTCDLKQYNQVTDINTMQ